MKKITFLFAWMVFVTINGLSIDAMAQDDWAADSEEQSADDGVGDPAQGPQESEEYLASAEPLPTEGQTGASQTAPPGTSFGKNLAELPGVGYHSVGMRFRWIFIPKWFITMFNTDIAAQNEKHPLISNLGLGVEYTYRKDNFDITAAIWGAQLDWEDPIYFKGSDEPEQSWTEVTNELSALLFTADFIWSSPIRDWVAITYGVGLGLGIPLGDGITETEAYPDGDSWAPCEGVGDPSGMYCEPGGEYGEKYDKLKVIPWINLLVGARFKPHEHMAIYVDGGFGIGFQMGVRGGYIF